MGFAKKAFNYVQQGANLPHRLLFGKKMAASIDLGGQLTGAHDDLYKPDKVAAIPYQDSTADANVARDRMRRMARKAAGRDSTIRTSPQGAAYSAAPKSLIGS